ncbi:MAG: hypothetical protein WKG01_37195 [Kofleriaceae bacterium]
MRIRTPESVARCAYTVMAGLGGDAGPVASSTYTFTAPPFAWYYLLARCPGAATDTYYFASSIDTTMRSSTDAGHDVRTTTTGAAAKPSSDASPTPTTGGAPTTGMPIMNTLPASVNGNVNDDAAPTHQQGVDGGEVGGAGPGTTTPAPSAPGGEDETTTLSETCKKDPKKCK